MPHADTDTGADVTARALARVEAARFEASDYAARMPVTADVWVMDAALTDIPLLAAIAAAAVEYIAAENAMEEVNATVDVDHRYYAARAALYAAIRAAAEAQP